MSRTYSHTPPAYFIVAPDRQLAGKIAEAMRPFVAIVKAPGAPYWESEDPEVKRIVGEVARLCIRIAHTDVLHVPTPEEALAAPWQVYARALEVCEHLLCAQDLRN